MPVKNPDVDLEPSLESIKSMYQYNPDIGWIAKFVGVSEDEILEHYGASLELLDSDKTRYVEYCLYYLATVKKDVRAILAWLEVHDASRYGKASIESDISSLKLDILNHLASKLPG